MVNFTKTKAESTEILSTQLSFLYFRFKVKPNPITTINAIRENTAPIMLR